MSPEKDMTLWTALFAGILTVIQGLWFFILRGLGAQIKANREEISECYCRNDGYFVPRKECERTHHAVDERLERVEKMMSCGFKNINERLDKLLERDR